MLGVEQTPSFVDDKHEQTSSEQVSATEQGLGVKVAYL
jgi:hypothetical protein